MLNLQVPTKAKDDSEKYMKSPSEATGALPHESNNDRVLSPTITQDPGIAVLVGSQGLPLVPQPNPDPLDPLNWSKLEKAVTLFIVSFAGFLSIYLTTAPIASLPLLQEQFNISYSKVSWSLGVPALGLAIGALFFAGFSDIWGRRAVLFSTTLVVLMATGCTAIPTLQYDSYLALRFLQGVGAGPALNVGYAIVQDITYEHERGFKTGLWIMAIDAGGIIGALGGFVAVAGASWVQYHVVIAYAVLFCLEAFLLSETLYPREMIHERIMRDEEWDSIKRTKTLKIWDIPKGQAPSKRRAIQTTIRFVQLLAQPRLLCAIVPYIFFQYWWVISILTMGPVAYAQYSTQTQGLLWLGLILGIVTVELVCSGQILDKIASRLATRNNHIISPEMYLWLAYPATFLSATGCIIWGLSIDRQWHFIIGELALFLFAAGLQMGNVTVVTYVVTAYPGCVLEVMSLYGVLYNVSAFLNPWYINSWVEAVGFTWCFATQGFITFLIIPCIMMLQRWGHKLATVADAV